MNPPNVEPPALSSGHRIATFALSNVVPLNLLFVVLVVVGGLVIFRIPVDVYPDVSLDEATIETLWLGASAEDVERLITDRIEEKIQDIRGIDRILSDSKPDASLIRIKFRESISDAELDASFRQLRAAVDQVVDLPADAEKPVVIKISVNEVFFLLWVAVEDVGNVGEEVLHDVAYRLKTVLREIPGVGKVDDKLIRDREVHIAADRDALRKHDLTLQHLYAILSEYNRNLPSGTLVQPGSEISIRAQGGVDSPEELGSIVVLKNPDGGHVYLRDVATIRTDFARKTFFARFNGKECLALGITKTDEADSREVAGLIYEAVDQFGKHLPEGVKLTPFDDASHIITSRLHILSSNLASGVVLVFLVLWAAVGLRNSILAIIGIPFAFCCALIAMYAVGVTINAISLIGLVLCAGMIVDDAIVVLENIYRLIEDRNIQRGERSRLWHAIVDGTGEVFWPVISSSMTTIAAFLPLLIMGGVTGEFFSIIPKTVTVVLLASLFECLLVLPVHYLDFGHRQAKKRPASAGAGNQRPSERGFWEPMKSAYGNLLRLALRHRYLTPLPLLALAFLAMQLVPLLDVELFPSDFQHCLVDLQVADEASLDQSGDIVLPIEQVVLGTGDDVVAGVLTSFGLMITEDNAVKLRNNLAQMHVQLASHNEVGADPSVVARAVSARIAAYVDAHPDCGLKSFRVWAPRSGPAIGKPVSVRIESPDFGRAKVLAEQYKSRLSQMDGVLGVKDDLEFGQQQIDLAINEDRASTHGLTFLALARMLRMANDGVVVSTFKDTSSGEDLDVRLKLASSYRRTLDDLLDLDILTPGGYIVPTRQVADIEITQGYAGIPHYNGHRAVTVTAEIDSNKTSANEVNAQLEREFAPIVDGQTNLRVVYGGQFAETQASFAALKEAYIVAIVAIYFLLATQFRSYVQPLVILSTVPFAGIGVVGGLLLSDYPFTIMTFIAIVGLSGVVVNDSILLVDCANAKRREGLPPFEAMVAACRQRLRPVIMTTVTTVLGILPLAIGLGGVSKIWSPFASSFAWGLTFATAITLFIVPAVYCMVQDGIALLAAKSASTSGDASECGALGEPSPVHGDAG